MRLTSASVPAVWLLVMDNNVMALILKLRNRHFFLLDVLALLTIPALALSLRLDKLNWWPQHSLALIFFTVVSLLVNVTVFYYAGIYRRYWRYANISDINLVLLAVGLTTTILLVLFNAGRFVLQPYHLAMYRSVPLLNGLLTCLAVLGTRLGVRGLYYWRQQYYRTAEDERVLIVGVNETARQLAKQLSLNHKSETAYRVIGFIDDNPLSQGLNINGLEVLAQVRADEKTKDLKVVMTSGLNLEDECMGQGANGFLLKPYMPDDLLNILKQNLYPS